MYIKVLYCGTWIITERNKRMLERTEIDVVRRSARIS